MKSPIPPHAERTVLGGETAWIWRISYQSRIGETNLRASGWSALQGPYQIDLENVESEGREWHTIDWLNRVPRKGSFEGGLAKHEAGHLEKALFLEVAEELLAALHRGNAPPSPPNRNSQPPNELTN